MPTRSTITPNYMKGYARVVLDKYCVLAHVCIQKYSLTVFTSYHRVTNVQQNLVIKITDNGLQNSLSKDDHEGMNTLLY